MVDESKAAVPTTSSSSFDALAAKPKHSGVPKPAELQLELIKWGAKSLPKYSKAKPGPDRPKEMDTSATRAARGPVRTRLRVGCCSGYVAAGAGR